jgi:hypothetical protein
MALVPHSTVATIVQAHGVTRNSRPVSAAGGYSMFKRTSYCASGVSRGLATSVTSVREARWAGRLNKTVGELVSDFIYAVILDFY